jgi:formate dehydrogenase subunit gamma
LKPYQGGGPKVWLEPVYCLGLCHSSPAALLDHDHVVGMLDEAKLDALLKEAQA